MRAILAAMMLNVTGAAAQDTLSSDRPGFSTGPSTVTEGRAQVEAGFQWDAGPDETSLPLTLLRYGIGPDTEVRASWNGVTLGGTAARGGSVEVKHTLGEGERGATGLLLGVSVPGGGGPLDPSASFLWSASLTDGLGLFGTATAGLAAGEGGRDATASNSVGLGWSLDDAWGLFAEHLVSVTEGEGDETQVIDGGVTYLVTPNLQLDLNAGVSVGAADAGEFVGGGLSYRF